MTMNIYYKQSDITASLSELMLSPWAKRWMDDYAYTAGVQEALHLIQDMINGVYLYLNNDLHRYLPCTYNNPPALRNDP